MIKYIYARILKKIRGVAIRHSHVHASSKIESGSQFVDSTMDRYSYCGYDCEIISTDIGPFCSLSNNIVIGGAMHVMAWASTSPVFYKGRDSVTKKFVEFERPVNKRTIIGHDVWIGEGAFLKQGIHVGNGSVIGMGAVVTKDVPAYAIVGGNPARIIRMRFSTDVISALEESKWWLKDDEIIAKCAMYVKDPLLFASKINAKKE